MRLEVLSEAAVDKLTDQVCTGATSDAQLYAEWSQRLAAKKAGGGAAGAAASRHAAAETMSVASSARSTRWTVRYRPVGAAHGGGGPEEEAGALRVRAEAGSIRSDGTIVAHETQREIGHRSMKVYYRQKFRPGHGDGISGFSSNPAMHALMLQYAQAGVLTNPMPAARQAMLAASKFEKSKHQVNHEKKMHVRQGNTNNLTAPGMKHFKNQSLNF